MTYYIFCHIFYSKWPIVQENPITINKRYDNSIKITSEKCPKLSKHAHLRSSNFNGLGWPASSARPMSNSAEQIERSPPRRTCTADRLASANGYAFSEPLRSAWASASLYSSNAFLSRALLKAALPSSLSLLKLIEKII